MKLSALLERVSSSPTSVEYEQEFTGADGEVDYRMLEVTGNLHTEYDPYGTGDSPSQSSFEPTGVYVKDTGEQLDLTTFLKSLDPKSYDYLMASAAENAD